MDGLLCLFLLLTHLPVIVSSMQKTKSCLSQQNKTIWGDTGQEVLLNCVISHNCSDLDFEWFVFKDSHRRLDLTNKSKYSLVRGSLHIKSLNANDSGIYHCAASSSGECCTQHVGQGATLVVRENVKLMVRHILLWLSFVLLAIYSLAIVILIFVKKYGCNIVNSRKTPKDAKRNSLKKVQFRDVLQELHSRRNMKKSKQTTSRNCSQAEAESGEFHCISDDIYQNV